MILYIFAFAFSCALILPAFRLSILSLLISSGSHSELDFSPNDLHVRQIALVILVLSTKALQQSLGLALDLHINSASRSPTTAYSLPALRLRAPVMIKAQDVLRYHAALDIATLAPKSPAHYNIFFLAGLSTPLMLLLLAKRSCPILPLGSVNVRNRFDFLNPRLCHDAARGLLRALGAEARLVSPGRRVKRGLEFDVIIEVTTGKADLVKDQVIFRQTITLLQFLSRNAEPQFVEEELEQQGARHLPDSDLSTFDAVDQKLDIVANAPMLWATFCKDYNPIHVSSWAAKTFGFPGKIAHGNLVAGQAIAVLAGIAGPQFSKMWLPDSKPSWLEVDFKRPMVVPTKLEILIDEIDERNQVTSHFRIEKESKVYIIGKAGWF
jgi:acyl dehydratase